MKPLEKILIEQIARNGPLDLEAFMNLALCHAEYGYYKTRDPFGEGGDFITAPEISQMFGELIGLWAADLWMQMGRPQKFILAEAGPGRGTLMADALRACKLVSGFTQAAEIHLIETSPVLREKQKKRVDTYSLVFHDDLAGLKSVQKGAPLILIANELLDALPVRQFSWQGGQWHERRVDYSPSRKFNFVWTPALAIDGTLPTEVQKDMIYEIGQARSDFVAQTAELVEQGGAALFIDYGYTKTAPGDTLQAVKNNAYHDILSDIGMADITAHVNFEACAKAAEEKGGRVFGPVTQGRFLLSLGLAERAQALIKSALDFSGDGTENRNRVQDIKSAVLRLSSPSEMGQLFKVMCVTHDKNLRPAGF